MGQTCYPGTEKQTAIEKLIEALSSSEAVLRTEARKSLVLTGEPAIIPLAASMAGKGRDTRLEIIRTLAEIRQPQVAFYVVKALEDDDPGVRWTATEGLIALGRKGLISLLEALTSNPDSLWLRNGAHDVMFELYFRGSHDSKGRYFPDYDLNNDSREALQPIISGIERMDPPILLLPYIRKALDILSENFSLPA
jgi:hypothetical protein